MADENPVLPKNTTKGGGWKRVLLWVLAAPVLLAVLLLTILATTGLPLTPVARIALKRAQLAPLEVSVKSLHLRWRLPGTLHLTVRGVRVEVRDADPVAAVEDAAVDLSIGRLMGRRILPSRLTASGVELWMRAKPEGGMALTIPAAAGVSAAKPSPPFTLSAIPASCWLLAGEETRLAVTGFQLHVLPATRATAAWSSPVLALEGGLAGRNPGMTAQLSLRNARGATLVEDSSELRPDAETVVSALTIPQLGIRDALAMVPPGLVPPGLTAESAVDLRLNARMKLPLTKEITANWEAHLSPGRLTLPGQAKPMDLPDTRVAGKMSLKGADLETSLRLVGGGSAPWADVELEAAVNLQSLKGSFRVQSPGIDLARLAAMVPQAGVSFSAATALKFEANAEVELAFEGGGERAIQAGSGSRACRRWQSGA